MAELQLEMFEGMAYEREELLERLDGDDNEGKMRDAMFDKLNALNKLLGYEEMFQDPLIDKWERELEEGKIPDLDEV